jgi:hypothetical protein
MIHQPGLVAALTMGFALVCSPLFALHARLTDPSGNTVFSEAFLKDYQRAGEAVNEARSVQPLLDLLAIYKTPNEAAELEVTIGMIYSQRTGLTDPAKAVEHLTIALGYRLPKETCLELLLWRAGSLEQLGQADRARRDHLRGLVACVDYSLPDEWPEIEPPESPVSLATGRSDVADAEEVERLRDYQRYIATVKEQQFLLRHQFYFLEGIKRIGAKSPIDEGSLQKLIKELTPDKTKRAAIRQLLRADNPQHPQQGTQGLEAKLFVGIWRTSSATTSVILAIRPAGKGLVLWIDGGSNSCEEVTWKEVPGGILVESIPRLRFWKGRHPGEARVEMEPLPPEWTSQAIQQFPRTFFMRRQTDQQDRQAVKNRPLPTGWNRSTLAEEWDKSAGKRAPLNSPKRSLPSQ